MIPNIPTWLLLTVIGAGLAGLVLDDRSTSPGRKTLATVLSCVGAGGLLLFAVAGLLAYLVP